LHWNFCLTPPIFETLVGWCEAVLSELNRFLRPQPIY
jgi:hypothetical protein